MPTEVNLRAEQTEAEWLQAFDRFWMRFTPRWFDWLQWILVLGVIKFIAAETQNKFVDTAYQLSHFGLYFYLQALFFSIEFEGFPVLKSRCAQRVASLLLSGLLTFAVWHFLHHLVSQLGSPPCR